MRIATIIPMTTNILRFVNMLFTIAPFRHGNSAGRCKCLFPSVSPGDEIIGHGSLER